MVEDAFSSLRLLNSARKAVFGISCPQCSRYDFFVPDYNVITVKDLSNQEFLKRYAAPGRVGLSGGPTLVDKAICRAQRHLHPHKQWGLWSHAFLFQGQRADGQPRVIE